MDASSQEDNRPNAYSKLQVYSNPFLLDFLIVCDKMPQDERDQLEAFTGEPYDAERAAIGNFMTYGPKWVFKTESGRPIAVGGYVLQRKGVWQDFLISTPELWTDHWFFFTRYVVGAMKGMFQSGEAHRLQCISLASRTRAFPWYKAIGYTREGTLHGYAASGADAVMFARVRH
jgi:hypothetical protein